MTKPFKPWITEYKLPDGSYRTAEGERVTKQTPGAVASKRRSSTYWGEYTDGKGKRHRVRLSESFERSKRMLAKLAGDAQLAGVGILDRYEEHGKRPLASHLDDFGRYLAAKGNTEDHVKKTVARCRAVLDGTGAQLFEDLQPSAVVEFLAGLSAPSRVVKEPPPGMEELTRAELADALGVSADALKVIIRRACLTAECEGNGKARRYPRSIFEALRGRYERGAGLVSRNHYLTAVKGFTRWLVRDLRTPLDPLVCLSRQNAKTDVRRLRRALAPKEFSALLDATRKGRAIRGLSGTERAALYLLAARSGLRASELASLTPASFNFADPSVTVAAAYSKHRREDVQPLPVDVAREMNGFCAGRAKGKALWPGTWPEVGADLLRLDLAAAGILYADEEGNVYDFHALRHQYVSDMVSSGVHPKDAQALARHSTITLTMDRYAHVRKADLGAALAKLPSLQTQAEEQASEARSA